MSIEYVSVLKKPEDTIELYKALKWYQLSGYTDEDIEKANQSFYSVYAYDGDTLIGLGRVASDGLIAAIMSGICVRNDYRRQGIGAEIVRRIVEYCQTGIYQMNVQLFCEDSLIKWYEGMGFEKMAVGMRKPMPLQEDSSALGKKFGDIYGIEQITDLCESIYWYDFNAFGDFSYYAGIGSEGVKVPFIKMNFYCSDPVAFTAEIIFENVSELEMGCIGVRTPLFGFDIVSTEKFGYSDKKRYMIRSLEDDDLSFFCETFRIMSVTPTPDSISITDPFEPEYEEEYTAEDDYSYADTQDYTDTQAGYPEQEYAQPEYDYSQTAYTEPDYAEEDPQAAYEQSGYSAYEQPYTEEYSADVYYGEDAAEDAYDSEDEAALRERYHRNDLSVGLLSLMAAAEEADDLIKSINNGDFLSSEKTI